MQSSIDFCSGQSHMAGNLRYFHASRVKGADLLAGHGFAEEPSSQDYPV